MIVAKHRDQASDDAHELIELEEIVVRFCGDSGDGMQLAGNVNGKLEGSASP